MPSGQNNSSVDEQANQDNYHHKQYCIVSYDPIKQSQGIVVRVTPSTESSIRVYCVTIETFKNLVSCPYTGYKGRYEYLYIKDISKEKANAILETDSEKKLKEVSQACNFFQSRFVDEYIENILHEKKLTGILSNLNFRNIGLIEKKFDLCVFLNCDFTRSSLVDSYIDRTIAERSIFIGACLNNVIIIDSSFRYTDFTNSDLQNVEFIYTDLRRVNFSGADLRGAIFNHCKTEGIKFSKDTLVSGGDLVGQQQLVEDFNKIYPVLKSRKKQFFPSKDIIDILNKKELIPEKMFFIILQIQLNPNGLAANALDLARRYVNNIDSNLLITDIYECLYEKSQLRLFSIIKKKSKKNYKERKKLSIKKDLGVRLLLNH